MIVSGKKHPNHELAAYWAAIFKEISPTIEEAKKRLPPPAVDAKQYSLRMRRWRRAAFDLLIDIVDSGEEERVKIVAAAPVHHLAACVFYVYLAITGYEFLQECADAAVKAAGVDFIGDDGFVILALDTMQRFFNGAI